MKSPRITLLVASLASVMCPWAAADQNHAAEDELAAAASVLAPKFDPKRDAVTIEKLRAGEKLAEEKKAKGKNGKNKKKKQ